MASPFPANPSAAPGAADSKPPKPKGLVWTGIILMLVSAVLGTYAGVRAFKPALDLIYSPGMNFPGTGTFDLEAGTYAVYERTGSAPSGVTINQGGSTTLTATNVTVQGPGSASVVVLPATFIQTINDNSSVYAAAVTFRAATAGSYRITITSEKTGKVLVGLTAESLGSRIAGWLVATLGAGFAFVIGFVLLIVGLVKRGRASRAHWQATHGPPGFAGYPGGPGPYPPGPYPPGAYPPTSYPTGPYPPGSYPPGAPGPPPGRAGAPPPGTPPGLPLVPPAEPPPPKDPWANL